MALSTVRSDVGQLREIGIEREILAERQADGARELQFRLLEFVRVDRGALRLGTELHFRAQHVDSGHQAVLLQIQRLVVQRLGGLLLGAGRFGTRARPRARGRTACPRR